MHTHQCSPEERNVPKLVSGKPVQLWNSWMILQGSAVRFLSLLLSLLRFFILIRFKIRACLAISGFSHAISPSLYLRLKRRMEKRERDSTSRIHEEWCLGRWTVGGRRESSWKKWLEPEDAWQSCSRETKGRDITGIFRDSFASSAGAPLAGLYIGPELCLLLLLLSSFCSQSLFRVVPPLLHPPPPICICSVFLAAPWQPAAQDIICSLTYRITLLWPPLCCRLLLLHRLKLKLGTLSWDCLFTGGFMVKSSTCGHTLTATWQKLVWCILHFSSEVRKLILVV